MVRLVVCGEIKQMKMKNAGAAAGGYSGGGRGAPFFFCGVLWGGNLTKGGRALYLGNYLCPLVLPPQRT
jgi:hypothetical protein